MCNPHPLNDDCWLNILNYVALEDQLSLAEVSQNLNAVVTKHWTRLKEAKFTKEVLQKFKLNEPQMHEIMKLCCDSLQELQLRGGSLELLRAWRKYNFPNLRTLDSEMNYNEENADEETHLLVELFPHLTKLTLHSSTTGKHLWALHNLKELHLIWCEDLDTGTFEQIFSSLKLKKLSLLYYGYNVNLGDGLLPASFCQTLEEILMDDHHLLSGVLQNFLQLPHLKKLTFYTRDYYEYILGVVAQQQPLKVESVIFNDAFWSSDRATEAILRMTNLRRLIFQDDDIDNEILFRICNELPHLEELHLIKMRALPMASYFWDMMSCCPTLNVLNLSNTKLDEGFVQLNSLRLERVLEKRRTPLKLHIHNSGLENHPHDILSILKHPNLKISLEPIELNTRSSRFIEIGFNPNAGI